MQMAKFLKGRCALVSFANPDPLPIVAEVCQSFIFDNGAFPAWKRGLVIDFDEYVRWVRFWHKHPGFDFAFIPDVIDGDEQTNDEMLKAWPRELPGVPVYHMHESITRLQLLCIEYRTVALGSSGEYRTPASKNWWKRMAIMMDAICDKDGRPLSKLHGLRMLNPEIFTRVPLSSGDSTNAGVNAGSLDRFGMYVPPSASVRATVIADRIEAHTSAAVWVRP